MKTQFGIYIDRPSLTDETVDLLGPDSPISEFVIGAEQIVRDKDGVRLRTRMMVRTEEQAIELQELVHGIHRTAGVRFLVWPEDATRIGKYDHLPEPLADKEEQDKDTSLNDADQYAGGTTYPYHALTGSVDFWKLKEREIQVYPTTSNPTVRNWPNPIIQASWLALQRTQKSNGRRAAFADATGLSPDTDVENYAKHIGIALPLYRLPKVAAREDLERWVRRCIELEVPRVRFWSVKHVLEDAETGDLDDETRAFLVEDLPRIVASYGEDPVPLGMGREAPYPEDHEPPFYITRPMWKAVQAELSELRGLVTKGEK